MNKVEIRGIEASDCQELFDLYQEEGWLSFSQEKIQALIHHSEWLIAVEAGEILGFARYLTDHVITLYLCEILVRKKARKQGIGKLLIEELRKNYSGLRIDLISEEDPFYQNLHFSDKGTGYRMSLR